MKNRKNPALIHWATDGEIYGHHEAFGDMALAALIKKIDALEVSSSPGVYVSKRSLREVVSGLSEKCGFVYLKEDGVDVRRYEFCDNPCFVLGDDRDLTREEENVISSRVCDKVSVGPLSLHADHCMIIVLNEIDRRQKEVFVGDVDIN